MEHLQFLGTCAHDYSKKLQNECRDRFDDDARRSSSALLSGHILIDCGTHTLDALRIAGITATITDLVLTHLHCDHFEPENIRVLAAGRRSPLRIWFSAGAKLPDLGPVELHPMEKGVTYSLNETTTVTGLDANHDAAAHPQHLLFTIGGRRLLYATDGAWICNTTCNFLRQAKAPLDVLIIDCTTGDYAGDWRVGEHNSIPMLRLMLPSLRTAGIISDGTAIYATHLAPSLHKTHAETVEILRPAGVSVARDGLEICI